MVAAANRAYLDEVLAHEIGEAERDSIGLSLVRLWLESHKWIQRRAEAIVLRDDSVADREVAISFALPRDVPTHVYRGREYCYVPLSLLRKRKVNLFHAIDEEGRRVPLLPREARGELAAIGLRRAAEAIMGGSTSALYGDHLEVVRASYGEIEFPADVYRDLAQIVTEPADGALPALQRFTHPHDADVSEQSAAARAWLMQIDAFRILVWSLALNSMVVVCWPLEGPATRTVLLKYAEPLHEVPPRFGRRARRVVRRLFRTTGVTPKKLWFPARALAQPGSNHYSVQAPSGLQISTATLLVRTLPAGQVRATGAVGSMPSLQSTVGLREAWSETDREEGALSAPHLYSRRLPMWATALIRVNIRPAARGTLRAVALSAVLAFGVLLAGLLQFDVLHPKSTTNEGSVGSTTALMLLLPTALAGWTVRPGERTLTSDLLTGTRLLGTIAGMLTLAAAATLALSRPGDHIEWLWRTLTIVGGVVGLTLTFSFGVNWAMRFESPRRRPSSGWARTWWRLRRRFG